MAKASITKDDVIEFVAGMSVLELSELVKEMEEKIGVSAAAPVAMMAAGPAYRERDLTLATTFADAAAEAVLDRIVYLGGLGVASLVCGFIAFEIIGLNMWASVNWDPIEFVRQLPWLALEPPPPSYGLSIPPLHDGGWWLMADQT